MDKLIQYENLIQDLGAVGIIVEKAMLERHNKED